MNQTISILPSFSISRYIAGTIYPYNSYITHGGSIYSATEDNIFSIPSPTNTGYSAKYCRDLLLDSSGNTYISILNDSGSDIPADSILAYDDTGSLTTVRDSSSFSFYPIGMTTAVATAGSYFPLLISGYLSLTVAGTITQGSVIGLDLDNSWTTVTTDMDYELGYAITTTLFYISFT